MRILHLTLKIRWFDMIQSGEKKEEYRELKDFWGVRLCEKIVVPWGGYLSKWTQLKTGDRECLTDDFIPNFAKFDVVKFTHGYAKDAPTVTLEFKETSIGYGKPEWGAEPGKEYFVIKLGDRIK
jgi:hypothetical protein